MSPVHKSVQSAADRAREIVQDFYRWVSVREAAGDWDQYVNHHGKLNRTKLAAEVGFASSCIRSNEDLKKALAALEMRLTSSGRLKASKPAQRTVSEATDDLLIQRLMAARVAAEKRAKDLEEKLATLKVQLHDKDEKLRALSHLDDHLAATGRLLRP